MANRLKAAVQHIHGRIRVDENWFITDANQLISKQIMNKEAENFKKLKDSISEEYQSFMKVLNSRRLELGSNDGEKVGNFFFTSSPHPPYAVKRLDLSTMSEEQVFSLDDVSELKRLGQKHMEAISPPVIRLSDDNKKVIAIVDILSNDRPSLYIKDIQKNKITDVLPLATSAAWLKDGSGFYYTLPDKSNRPYIINLHKLGSKVESDKKIYEEPDDAFYLEMSETKDKKYTIIYSMSRVTTEVSLIDRSAGSFTKLLTKRPMTRYYIEHNKGYYYVITNYDSPEFKVLKFPVGNSISSAEVILQGDLCIDEVDMYEYFMVIYCRIKGVPSIKLYDITTGKISDLILPHKDSAFSIQPGSNLDYTSEEFTLIYSSPTVYEDTFTYNFKTKQLKLTNHKKIVGAPLKLQDFISTRTEAASYDGTLVPITLFHHKDIKKDRKNRVILKGYGAYGQKHDHSFKYSEIVAVEQGWVIANAHVRGEGEYGMSWHKAAIKEKKANSFEDLIACAAQIISSGYTEPRRLAGYGTSAGGLLMAQAVNLNPELFAAIVLEVPFVDPLSEMLNKDLPLSVTDRDEWGDPLNDVRIFDLIRSYAPYDNLSYARYPPMLITASMNDSRVSFAGVLKYIKRLRSKAYSRGSSNLCEQNFALHITEGGHFGQGDLESEAIIWAFLNKAIPLQVI